MKILGSCFDRYGISSARPSHMWTCGVTRPKQFGHESTFSCQLKLGYDKTSKNISPRVLPIIRHSHDVIKKTPTKLTYSHDEWSCSKSQISVSKQELYFVKENYEIFSTEVSAREKNKGRTVVSHIKELLGLLEFHPSFGHFEFGRRLGSSWASMFHIVAFSLSNSYFFRPLVKFL